MNQSHGRHVALFKDLESEDGSWWFFDDAVVKKCTFEEYEEEL